MFIDLVDKLRCVNEHELDWLVASTGEMYARDIVRGALGCPRCKAQYQILRGVANFTRDAVTEQSPRASSRAIAPEEIVRLGALLDLSSPGGLVVLLGEWGAHAPMLASFTEELHVLVIDPDDAIASGGGVSLARTPEGTLPLRPAVARGVALDATHGALAERAALALAPHGRLIAPASIAVPDSVTELARDEQHWVATRDVISSDVIPLGRARPRSLG